MRRQSTVTRLAASYLRDFPIVRGRGLVNRLLGRFLEIRLFDGIRLRLVNPLEYHQRVLLFSESYEPETTRFLAAILRPGMVFMDVGANLGYYTLLAAKRVGPGGQVHAFEPAPAQFRHLSLNVGINSATNVALNNCAMADRDGEADLFLSDGWNQGTHSLGKTLGQKRSCRVRCTSLDHYVARAGITRLDVIKVDVEGAEFSVFRGGSETLASLQPRVLLFEACEEYAQSLGHSTGDVRRLLETCGYVIFRLDPAPAPVQVMASSVEPYANLVAMHSEAENWYYEALVTTLRGAFDPDRERKSE